MGMEKLNPVTVISHPESTIDEVVEFTTSTQYGYADIRVDVRYVQSEGSCPREGDVSACQVKRQRSNYWK